MKFPSQKIYLLIVIAVLLLSCKKEKKIALPTVSESEQLTTPSDTKDSIYTKVANLEDIPFDLPENWVYNRFTDEVRKTWKNPESGLVAIANEPANGIFTVTVWEYKVKTLEELLPLFKNDIETLGVSVEYKVENGIVYGISIQKPVADFQWKGKHVKNGDKTTFIAVGSLASIYDDNIDYIDSIFNSIHVP